MKKYYFLIIVTLILGLVLTGCLLSNVGQVPTSEQSGITYLTKGVPGDHDVFTLYAGQDINVGTVNVWNDCKNLYVKYETTGDWVMTETHLAVADSLDGIPQTKKGNPIPGQFPYQCCYDEDATQWEFQIKEDGDEDAVCDAVGTDLLTEITYIIPLGSDTELYIAAHASLLKLVDTVEVYADKLTPTDSNVPLESDKNYLLKASGTAFASANIEFDAKYSTTGTGGTWTDLVTGYEPPAINLLDLKVDGEFVDWGAYNPDHVYYWDMTGKGSRVALLIYDTYYSNNTEFLTVDIYLYQEESAWAGMDEGGILFSAKNWATYFTYHIAELPTISSDDLAGPFTVGDLEEFTVRTVNPLDGFAYEHVLFNYTMFGITPSDIKSFEYLAGSTWVTAPVIDDPPNVTGHFGPEDGFLMSAPYEESTLFRINFNTAGTYKVIITLNDLDNSDAVLATLFEDVVVLPAIGDSYGGGIVAYIFVEGDNGYVQGEQHGLIVVTADQSTGRQWYNNGIYEETGTTGTAIGTGQANTTAIVEKQGVGSYAAQLCNDLTEGGYNDWFLPSKDELNKLYLNKVEIGGFAVYDDYWSSSEGGANYAWSQDFSTGWQTNFYKYAAFWVRAVRVF